jgi:enamine deaminase RidA (YjgF/YER057c/UK114 family)
MRQKVSSGEPFENVYGYSRAVQVGDHIHVSGTTARPPDLDGDTYRQARAALSIIETALQEVGSSLADVVRTVTYVMDIDDAEMVARAHREVFGDADQLSRTPTSVLGSSRFPSGTGTKNRPGTRLGVGLISNWSAASPTTSLPKASAHHRPSASGS